MMKVSFLATTIGLSVASIASADFIGFDGTVSENDQGNTVVMMYGVYDNSDTILLNLFAADIGAPDGFIHSDVQVAAGGTWTPSATLDIPGFSDSGNDSYVTVGYAPGATNSTALDPGFGSGLGATIPVGAGWYNGNPNNAQGVVEFAGGVKGISGFAALVGQFVFTGDEFAFIADIGSNTGAGTAVDFGQGEFILPIPAPGALALLGLGGLVARRRRG
jgi:hypothetical protein